MPDELKCRAVVVRSHAVDEALPWPHWIGALPSEEKRPGFVPPSSPTHPFRGGEFDRPIALAGDMDPLELGTVMAAICLYHGCTQDDDERAIDDAREILRRLLELEAVIVRGGVEVTANGAVAVTPECCAGLEHWREWITFAEGGPPPWGGHSPDPHIVRLDSGLLEIGYSHTDALLVEPAALRAALREVEQELAAFTAALRRWAGALVPELAGALVDKLSRDLALLP